jgi:hypothetical protein
MIGFIYLVSIAYCIWRMYKGYKRSFGDGNPIGPTPGLETLFIVIFAPVLAAVDLSLTWIRLYREAEETRIDKRNNVF